MTSSRSYLPTAIRVLMGAFFLFEFVSQLSAGWLGGDGLADKLSRSIAENDVPPPYTWFLENVVTEYDGAFTVLTLAGEFVVGAGLILGLATRFSAFSAAFMNANFWLMNGTTTIGAIIDVFFIAGGVVVALMASRQALSVDGRLGARGVRHLLLSGDIPAAG